MTSAKKIMLLGGNYFQATAILAAKKAGLHVISVDYLPGNPGHRFADEYYNISTTDEEGVLKKARELGIDGIWAYASDVSAPTAAYVAEALGLPGNPYESVRILTDKQLFRKFLSENGFPAPVSRDFTDPEEALAFIGEIGFPAAVKPVDSSGSKGVGIVRGPEEFRTAWDEALKYSRSGRVIAEEFIERSGYQIDGDIFVDKGEIVFSGLCDQHHDLSCTPWCPVGHSFPPTQNEAFIKDAVDQIRRVLALLHMKNGGYNIEYVVRKDGTVFLMEIGPRNGGNLIPDAVREACGADMAEASVLQAVGEDPAPCLEKSRRGCASSYIIHSLEDGRLKGIGMDEELRKHIVLSTLLVPEGERVRRFRNASDGIGAMILRFEEPGEMCAMIDGMNDHLQVITEQN